MIYGLEVRFTDEKGNKYRYSFGTHFNRNKEASNTKLSENENNIIETKKSIITILKTLFKDILEN